jgi:hypothetical protein
MPKDELARSSIVYLNGYAISTCNPRSNKLLGKTPGLLLAPFSRYIKIIERQTQMQQEKMRNARGRANEVYIGTKRSV